MPEERQYTLKELQQLREIVFKHDVSSTNAAGTQVAHGPNYQGAPGAGLFSSPGARPEIFSTLISGGGLLDVLPIYMSNKTDPEYEILTGITAARGPNATNFCATPARAGLAKLCKQVARFGAMFMQTDTVVLNQVGGRLNHADTDRVLLNPAALPDYLPDILKRTRNINSQDWFQLYTLATSLMRALKKVAITGNHSVTPANAEIGFIKEFDGLDQLIKTGHVDAETDQACPAADSIIVDWGDNDISATVDGDTFVQMLANVMYVLFQMAIDMNMGDVNFAGVLYPDLFYAITRVWPCLDMLAGCSIVIDGVNINSSNNIDAATQRRLQDDMFFNRYLPVDGKRIPIITEQGVPLENSGDGFSSSFYIVPRTVMGNYPVWYFEGFDQGNAEATAMANLTGSNPNYMTSNKGFWAIAAMQTLMCMQYALASQPRMILETPWLAARIDGIKFKMNRYSRQMFPGDPYHYNGGVVIRYPDQLYS